MYLQIHPQMYRTQFPNKQSFHSTNDESLNLPTSNLSSNKTLKPVQIDNIKNFRDVAFSGSNDTTTVEDLVHMLADASKDEQAAAIQNFSLQNTRPVYIIFNDIIRHLYRQDDNNSIRNQKTLLEQQRQKNQNEKEIITAEKAALDSCIDFAKTGNRAKLEDEYAKTKMPAQKDKTDYLKQRKAAIESLEQGEREKIKYTIKTKYGIDVPVVEEYEEEGEKLSHLTTFFNKYINKLKNTTDRTPAEFLDVAQNNSGRMTSEMIDFMTRLIEKRKDKIDIELLKQAINVVKDQNGNISHEKEAQFLAYCSYDKADLGTIISYIESAYSFTPEKEKSEQKNSIPENKPMPKDLTPAEIISNSITKARRDIEFAERTSKAQEIMNKLNAMTFSDGTRKFYATMDNEGFLHIETPYITLYPHNNGIGEEEFKYIKSIKGHVNFRGYSGSIGALETIYGNALDTALITDFEKVTVTVK